MEHFEGKTIGQVKAAIAYSGHTVASVAAKMGTTRQGLHRKITTGTLRPADLRQIADIVGAEYVSKFKFPDGTEI